MPNGRRSRRIVAVAEGDVDAMGTIAVRRPNDMGGRFRRLKIYIDGQEVAGLRPNQTYTAELADGVHEVRGRMDWARSKPLSVGVTGDELVSVEVSLPFRAAFKVFTDPKHAVQVRQL
jgi:hypothetical protein